MSLGYRDMLVWSLKVSERKEENGWGFTPIDFYFWELADGCLRTCGGVIALEASAQVQTT